MKFKCVTKCFYENRLWTPGETLEVAKGAKVPKHFKDPKDIAPKKVLSRAEEEKRIREAVGHQGMFE